MLLICSKSIPHRMQEGDKKKKSAIYNCAAPLLCLHVQHQSIHSGKTLHSQHAWKRETNAVSNFADFTQSLIEPLSESFHVLLLSFFCHMCDTSKSYFHVLAPLLLKANTRRYVLMIVSSGHLSTVKPMSSEEVNTASELWLF